MKKIHSLLAVISFLLVTQATMAQDVILKKDNELIQCKIKEIGLDEIKYTLPEFSEDVSFSIDKDKITKIIFENGKEMSFQKEMTNPENYVDNKKNALKISFLSPLAGSTSFSYERSLRPGRSLEGTIGIIGLGIDNQDENAGGAFVKFGYKFIKDPDFYLRGMRYAHILKGGYIKPELSMAFFSHDSWYFIDYYPYESGQQRENVFSGTVQLVFGKQWVFDNAFLVDLFAGAGYGFSSSEYGSYNYGFVTADNSFPVSFSSGIKIGFLFK